MSELKVRIPNNIKSQLESTAIDCFGKKNNSLDIAVSKVYQQIEKNILKYMLDTNIPAKWK